MLQTALKEREPLCKKNSGEKDMIKGLENFLEKPLKIDDSDIEDFTQGITEIILKLKSENAALREELEDYKIEERRAERISKHRAADRARVEWKIRRCHGCEHKGHSPEFEGGFRIEICKCPPYRGKWIAEIEKCPKAELKGGNNAE